MNLSVDAVLEAPTVFVTVTSTTPGLLLGATAIRRELLESVKPADLDPKLTAVTVSKPDPLTVT